MRVLLADDHEILRNALRAVFEREPDIEVVAEASDGLEAVRLAEEINPDVIVMDVSMPHLDGIRATRKIVGSMPNVKVVALSMHAEHHFIARILAAGARGYVVKTSGMPEMLKALRAVYAGGTYLCHDAANATTASARANTGAPVLNRREKEFLTLLALGKSSEEISDSIRVAGDTVDVHLRNIMRKLGLHSVAELTQYAIREGLISV